ncbi:unnamed protein product [Didymodactylos carnosus]|uniref:Peptidase M28 domain-containing protein n=1 Tax=Didymodactylos carnosus TaxID=1234261 RepID=A0A814KIV8_9BILA|nr:unnamed protein product [Didymodactylos carnosus]CAF1050100.1 unnamed protein product [Didymodactylos carnosus]CAF3657904.1 unnamed protein product [Didymodactylos carnosus]CAF3819735.1 unnamed protein product [Didymodactylos carnosus]
MLFHKVFRGPLPLVITTVCIIFFGIGIIIGHFAILQSSTKVINSQNEWKTKANDESLEKDYFVNFVEKFLRSVDRNKIRQNLEYYSQRTHLAGTDDDYKEALYISQKWRDDGLSVTIHPYQGLLSYPHQTQPNIVSIFNGNGDIIYRTNGSELTYSQDEHLPVKQIVKPFLAFTPNGTVQFAEQHGAIGVILFSDPVDFAPLGTTDERVYPNSFYMPDMGIQRGSAYLGSGDILTQNYPATDRYVIVGNHFDSWTFGSIDDGSGMAISFELVRIFGIWLKAGWRPKRSIVFCAFGAEEYSTIGSMEWVQVAKSSF